MRTDINSWTRTLFTHSLFARFVHKIRITMKYLIFGQQLNISSEIYEGHRWPRL